MTATYFHNTTRDGEPEVEIEVEYTFRVGSAPVTWGPPESCDPGSPNEIEIVAVSALVGGAPVTLTDTEAERIEGEIDEGHREPEREFEWEIE